MSSSPLLPAKLQGAAQDQPLRKPSLSEGSDSRPCKEPTSRSACGPLAAHRSHFCCLSPFHSQGCLHPMEPGLCPDPCQGSGNGQWSPWKCSLPPQHMVYPSPPVCQATPLCCPPIHPGVTELQMVGSQPAAQQSGLPPHPC